MKRLFITLNLIIAFTSLFAQNVSDTTKVDQPDTTIIDFKNKQIIIIEKSDSQIKAALENRGIKPKKKPKLRSKLGGLHVGLNAYTDTKQKFSMESENEFFNLEDSKSFEVGITVSEAIIPIISDKVAIVSGFGIVWNNYRFENKQLILKGDESVLYFDTVTVPDYKKNKLTTTFLTVPLGLEIHIPSMDNTLWLYFGGFAQVKTGSFTKLIADNGDKDKSKGDFHLNPFRYGLRAHAGMNDFSVFATYSVTTLFKKNKAPEIYPISVGLSLSF